MNILVSGSLAYDRIMDFPGKFADHILPEKIHILNVCFVIEDMRENFGGTAGNIAYALSLFGENPIVIATAGRDFAPYREWLHKNRISSQYVTLIQEVLTAGAYITTDKADNQITAFNAGAMKFPAVFDFNTLSPQHQTIAIVSPGNLKDMSLFPQTFKQKEIPYIFDPGQSIPALHAEELVKSIEGSWILICNDYELELIMNKISLTTGQLLERTEWLIVTKGEYGSIVMVKDNGSIKSTEIPSVTPKAVCDPTGAGDAFRAGLIKGLVSGKDMIYSAKMGAVCAAYCVEVYGTQTYTFTQEAFEKRFAMAFG
jgi:adenosine kinase